MNTLMGSGIRAENGKWVEFGEKIRNWLGRCGGKFQKSVCR